MKILVLVPVWQRPEIFRVMAEDLKFPDWVEGGVVPVYSLEDKYLDENMETPVNYYSYAFVEKNNPLGYKMNQALRFTLNLEPEWDYLLGLNSDDLLHPDYWDKVRPYLEAGHPMVGMNQIIAYDVPNKRGMKLKLEEKTTDKACMMWGGGRFISRDALERTIKKIGYVYDDHLNSGLDTSSQNNLFHNNMFDKPPIVIDGCYLCDLKTEENINPYFSLKNIPHEGLKYEDILRDYPAIAKLNP